MAFSANKTKISFAKGATGTNFTEIPLLMEVPELGGTPEKIDITTLSDPIKKYIAGIKDCGDLVFKFLYDNSSTTANYRVLKAEENKPTTFKVDYPDGSSHEFVAAPSVKMDAGTINGALTFSATMMLQSDITVTNPTA